MDENFELPVVHEQQAGDPEVVNNNPDIKIASTPSAGPGAAASVSQTQANLIAQGPAIYQQAQAQRSLTANLPADDADLIEKQWVEAAKKVIKALATDPYKQTIEISKIKTDYVKKRYNKDLKAV
jgi:hypothetical protein